MSILIMLSLVAIITIGLASQLKDSKRRDQWAAFDGIDRLKLYKRDFGFFGYKNTIAGQYRNKNLTLDTIDKQPAQSPVAYTQVTLTLAEQSLSPQTLASTYPSGNRLTVLDISTLLLPNKIELKPVGKIRVDKAQDRLVYEEKGTVGDVEYLTLIFDLLADISEGYYNVCAIGGDAIPALCQLMETHRFMEDVCWGLISDIAVLTKKWLYPYKQELLCQRCIAHPVAHKKSQGRFSSVSYYGCRRCGQTRDFINGQAVAVLDSTMAQEIDIGDEVRVNWLQRQSLFDFERVEILSASDEDVERFVMQVSNNTASDQQKRYARMSCIISPTCNLSENTRRLLSHRLNVIAPEPRA